MLLLLPRQNLALPRLYATGGHFGNDFANDSADTGKRFFRGSCKPRERGKLCAQTHMLVVLRCSSGKLLRKNPLRLLGDLVREN